MIIAIIIITPLLLLGPVAYCCDSPSHIQNSHPYKHFHHHVQGSPKSGDVEVTCPVRTLVHVFGMNV